MDQAAIFILAVRFALRQRRHFHVEHFPEEENPGIEPGFSYGHDEIGHRAFFPFKRIGSAYI